MRREERGAQTQCMACRRGGNAASERVSDAAGTNIAHDGKPASVAFYAAAAASF